MKKLIVLLFFAQFISFMQTAQVKHAADACPGANKNNRTSNDYAYLSKRSAAQNISDFSKPKYQSIYAKNTSSSVLARRGKAASVKRNATPPIAEETEKVVPNGTLQTKKENTPVAAPEENTSIKSEREPEPEFKTEEPKPVEVEKEDVKKEVKNIPAPEPTKKEKGKSASSKKDKRSLETTTDPDSKTKQEQKYRAKKIKCGKGGADDCPQF
jgi:outer membrane biosynthesis protein TonB